MEAVDLEKVLRNLTNNFDKLDNTTLNYLLICLAKIRVKTSNNKVRNSIVDLLNKMKNSTSNLFLRIKAQQILDLTNLEESVVEEIFEPVPGGAIDAIFEEYVN